MYLTSKLITRFVDGFTMKRKSQSIAYLLNGSEHIYWIFGPWKWSALNMGYIDKRPSRMQRQFYFSEPGGMDGAGG